jgi:hypothetical protein
VERKSVFAEMTVLPSSAARSTTSSSPAIRATPRGIDSCCAT